jgi:HD-GYP domain-containing protein (c-di-GMP phosphodiesterase class II)
MEPARVLGQRKVALRVHIAVAFVALLGVTGLALVGYSYYATSRLLLSASAETSRHLSDGIANEASRIVAPAGLLASLLARHRLAQDTTLAARLESLPFLTTALTERPQIAAIYVGGDGGDFFLVRPVRDEAARQRFQAPANAAFLVQSSTPGTGATPGRFIFLAADLAVLRDEVRPDYRFDPRTRDWYRQAVATAEPVHTPPYAFFTTREVGTTVAQRSRDGRSVIGVDITLVELSRRLAARRVSPSARIALVDADGRVIAHPEPERLVRPEGDGAKVARLHELDDPVLAELFARWRQGATDAHVTVGGREWIGVARRVPAEIGEASTLLFTAPRDEILADARSLARQQLLIGILLLALAASAIWLLARRISRPLEGLAAEARAIRGFEFGEQPRASTWITEVDDLAEAMAGMRTTIRQFLETSSAVAAEEQVDRLLERVIDDTVRTAGAEEGVLYLLEDATGALARASHRDPLPTELATLFPERLDGDTLHPCRRAAATRATVIEPAPGPRPGATVAVPLVSRTHELVGVLGLRLAGADLGAAADGGRNPRVAFAEALSSVAAVAIETRHLIQAEKALLDAFIQVVAAAIDAKSPYTGGHCQRVPVLARMLAEAACGERDGSFRDFALDDTEWETLHIASWLHDCGKVTTPEHVVDKAVKLETIYNRIHEIRTRFEVLKRDADVACWRAVAGGADADAQHAIRDALHRTLDEEFAFVAECNVGGESMSSERLERLRAIATRTWTRTLDDRLGLSEDEQKLRTGVPRVAPPAEEPLLADRREHTVGRRVDERIPADNRWGFRLDVPERKLNLGEVYNLSIGRGTLTDEERYIINHHVVQTTLMLARLPFPRHLRAVPEIAGAHHERIDGRGYPRRLTGKDTHVLARIIAIADVFEALTASDRPYKAGKPLSESLRIMEDMARTGHIDRDLFGLFVRAGVYRRYAEAHLAAAQMDAVDERALLAP